MTRMRARWVLREPESELPTVGYAIVAKWWPGIYYLVSTIQLDLSDPVRRLAETISGMPSTDAFLTNIYRCNGDGFIGNNPPMYRRTYQTLEEAKAGHERTLTLVARGRNPRR
jgi:hypothetical protein